MDNIDDCINLKSFQIVKTIGEGTFGDVFLIKKVGMNQQFAAKVIKKSIEQNTTEELISLFREIMINSKLDHPNTLKFIGISPFDFEKKPKFTIVTEYASNGSLENILELERHGLSPFNWNDTKKLIIIYGIASGMAYLHSHNIIHRDLKPANILLDDYLFPKISDFGLSKVKDDNVQSLNYQSKVEIKGTPAFLAPEIWTSFKFTEAGDVYAFALIVYEIMTGEVPWSEITFWLNINTQVREGNRPQFKTEVPESYKKLIEICWSQEPEKRPTFNEIVDILKKDEGFITDLIDANDYITYIQYIEDYQSNEEKSLDIEKYFSFCSDTFKAVQINRTFRNTNESITKLKSGYLFKSDYDRLSKDGKKLVDDAEIDPEKQFILAQKLFEGKDGFPKNVEASIKYMKISIRSGNVDSAIYYSRLLIQGDIILKNTEKAAKILKKFLPTKNSNVYTLYGLIQKEDEEYELALKYFRKASESGNGEAMYEYAKLVYEGLGTKQNSKKALQLFEMAKQNNFPQSEKYINLLTDNDEVNYQFDEISKIIDVPFDNKQINAFRGIIWYLGKGNPRNSYDKQIIDILASSQYPPDQEWFLPQNVVDFKNIENTSSDDCCYHSHDIPNSWLCYDFKDIKVKPTNYSIRSNCWHKKGWYHPLNWVIESSNDLIHWNVLDEQMDLFEMDDSGVIKTFELINDDETYRYLRIRQTGLNSHKNNSLTFSALEFFGTFIRP